MVDIFIILIWTVPFVVGMVILQSTTGIKATNLIVPIIVLGFIFYMFGDITNLFFSEINIEEPEEIVTDFNSCFNELMDKGYDNESTILLCKTREQNLGGVK